MRLISFEVLGIIGGSAASYGQSPEPYNHAAVWRSWDSIARETYVRGVVDGASAAYLAVAKEWLGLAQLTKTPEPLKVRAVREKVFLRDVEGQVPAVVSDLYRDPSNAYVALIDMVHIARDKLEGKSVDQALADARKAAVELNRLTGKLKDR